MFLFDSPPRRPFSHLSKFCIAKEIFFRWLTDRDVDFSLSVVGMDFMEGDMGHLKDSRKHGYLDIRLPWEPAISLPEPRSCCKREAWLGLIG